MSILCPYCLNNKPRHKIFADEIQYRGGAGIKTINGINHSAPEIYRSYQCPRCKIKFNTKESLFEYNSFKRTFTKKLIKDLKEYDERKRKGLEPPRRAVRKDIQDLILKVFGSDIEKDIDIDLHEIEKNKK